jgi:3-hydroxyisobutyrate dehydrogenase-like beta-hydroxyacid dehydrogenase
MGGEMKKIGFVGLGQMGKWMARNLIKGGFQLTVFDVNPEAVHFLTHMGAQEASSPAEMAADRECCFLSLPDTETVEEVLFGLEGVIQGAHGELGVVDCGTTSYLHTLDFARRLEERGVAFADAPVSGMEARAKDGTLTVMFGGEEAFFTRVRPALEVMGDHVLRTGRVGTGQLTKLVNQLLFNISAAALAEVLPMAAKLGLDPEKTAQVVTTGTGRSFAAEFFIPLILEGRFDRGYPLDSAYKDMVSAAEICAREKIPLPLVHAATTTYQMALAEGWGREGKGAMVKVFERVLGASFRKKGERG